MDRLAETIKLLTDLLLLRRQARRQFHSKRYLQQHHMDEKYVDLGDLLSRISRNESRRVKSGR